MRDMFVVAT